MKAIVLLLISVFGIYNCAAQVADLETQFEKSGGLETPRYAETIRFCKLLAAKSENIHYTTFGLSAQNREMPVLIYDCNKNFTAESVRKSGNLVLFVQACIHPGESEGKDAGLMLFRDIIRDNKYAEQLKNISIVFLPIFNVDGHERFSKYARINQNGPKEMGWRTTANNHNLNRDFMKADSREMRNWLALYNDWLPEFLIDCHTTDGSDYQYDITYGIEIYGNTESGLSDWMKNNYLTPLKSKLEKSGHFSFPYVMFRNWHDPKSGLQSRCSPAMLCGGYIALQNRASILMETHSLKDYSSRVTASYDLIQHTLEILSDEKEALQKSIDDADQICINGKLSMKPYPLQYDLIDDSIMVEFKGKEYFPKMSKVTGKEYYSYTDELSSFQIPYFKEIVPSEFINLPLAYIIPAEWENLIDIIAAHKIEYKALRKETTIIDLNTYRFDSVKLGATSYEGRQRVQSLIKKEISITKTFPEGSIIILTNQQKARVLIDLLEPHSFDSFVKWGFLNNMYESKEYFETYVMEPIAEQMIQTPAIRADFEKAKAENPDKFIEQREILNWFYERSPYFDAVRDVYPIGRIFDKNIIKELLAK